MNIIGLYYIQKLRMSNDIILFNVMVWKVYFEYQV